MSPRRSSRARTTQPTPTLQQHTNSSTSSVSSTRPDHNARSNGKDPSLRSSVAPRSQSSDDRGGSMKSQARRTRSSQDDAKDEAPPAIDDEHEEEGEEEVTRCICGSQEYPGLPVNGSEPTKITSQIDSDPISLAEDSTGWFIQCDECKVWQHGGCVGIMEADTSPEEYFCEQCRKDLHKVFSSANGRKYSHYLPVQNSKSAPWSPEPKVKEASRKTRDSRASRNNVNETKGRRATMNSRESAYDETETLRRVIELSKKVSGPSTTGTGTRKGKRSRSESEERQEDAKRQRTTSGSSSSRSKATRQDADSASEAEKADRSKNIRGAAARNHSRKETRDREAAREKIRAETRQADESDPSPDPPSSKTNPPKHLLPPAAKPSHHKKTGRPPTRKGRVGRNQYTKDPPPRSSPARSPSEEPHLNGTAHTNGGASLDGNNNNGVGAGVGKPSKPRHMNPNRTSMNDMKRRVAGILDFISHTQVEMAGVDPSTTAGTTKTPSKNSSVDTTPDDNGTFRVINGRAHSGYRNGNGIGNGSGDGEGVDMAKAAEALRDVDADAVDEEAFRLLSSVQMMEVLTRRLMRWQGEYGKYGEK